MLADVRVETLIHECHGSPERHIYEEYRSVNHMIFIGLDYSIEILNMQPKLLTSMVACS